MKVGDDCRQDVLALQLIAILRDVYVAAGLQLYLFPYGVLPTGYERGIIQVTLSLTHKHIQLISSTGCSQGKEQKSDRGNHRCRTLSSFPSRIWFRRFQKL